MYIPEGIAFTSLLPRSLKFEKHWDLRSSSDPSLIGIICFYVGSKIGLLMRLWGQFKMHNLPPPLGRGHSLLFELSSIYWNLLFNHTYLPSLVWLFIPRWKACWGQKYAFKLTAQLPPADFKGQIRFIFLFALQ